MTEIVVEPYPPCIAVRPPEFDREKSNEPDAAATGRLDTSSAGRASEIAIALRMDIFLCMIDDWSFANLYAKRLDYCISSDCCPRMAKNGRIWPGSSGFPAKIAIGLRPLVAAKK